MHPGTIFKKFVLCAGILIPLAANAAREVPVTEPSSSTQIEQRLENIERLLQNQGLLDMLQQIQRLQQEVTALRGQLEVNNHELEILKEKQRKLYNDIDNRLQQLTGQAQEGSNVIGSTEEGEPPLEIITPSEPVATSGSQAESSLTVENVNVQSQPDTTEPDADTEITSEQQPLQTTTVEPAPANPVEIQAHYQEAFRLLKQADYDQAITAFDKFLTLYPESQYSDNAQYWMGEAYYVTRRFEAAITEYMKLISNYPQSQRVPNGLLKIGYSYYELGKPEEGNKVLKELIEKYPGTSAASDAATKLNKSSSAS